MAANEWTGKRSDDWKTVDRLVDEQKFEAAAKLVHAMLVQDRVSRRNEEWVRCLIWTVRLRTVLHGYETAVKFLKTEPWPEDSQGRSVLNLYYAHSLLRYARSYSWEIHKRERVETKGEVDLKAWTMDQIFQEAQHAFEAVWQTRDQLGDAPVSMLEEYIEPNNYPRNVRSTLRCAASYLYVEMLADESFWRPEHANEIFLLNLKRLLAMSEKEAESVSLTDPAIHPLEKICAILADLEDWSRGENQRETGFEARLERFRRLRASFTDAADRARIKENLEAELQRNRDLPWWAMGMALLTEFTRDEETADNLIRAREIARQGHEKYPESVGGKTCLNIVESIEASDFRLEAMASDGPNRQSLGLTVKNLPKVHFRAWSMDLVQQIQEANDYNLLPGRRTIRTLVKSTPPVHEWTAAPPPAADFKMHRLYVTPPMKTPGFYVVAASAREDFADGDNEIAAVNMIIGDLALVSHQEYNRLEATVFSGSSGKPVSGAEIALYELNWRKGHKQIDLKKSDAQGAVRFSVNHSHNCFLLAKKGADMAIDPNQFHMNPRKLKTDALATLLFTDRSIYRPLQKIYWKAVVYKGQRDSGRFETRPSTTLTISLKDPNHQVVESITATTNEFGTASGEFTIPSGRLLGLWRVHSSARGAANVRVEEYKRPTFEARLLEPKNPLRLNQPAVIEGEARYYFGLPVADGRVKWRVQRTPVHPPRRFMWGGPPGGAGDRAQTIAAGMADLSDDGAFELAFTPEADERLDREISYRYTVTAEVVDEGGETRTAARTFRLGFVSVRASAFMEAGFLLENRPSTVTVTRTDLDGAPAPGPGEWRLLAVKGPVATLLPADQPLPRRPGAEDKQRFQTPDDARRPRWNPGYRPEEVMRSWEDGAEIARGEILHDEGGRATLPLPALEPGAWRLRYRTADPHGELFEMSTEFIVAGAGPGATIPAPALLLVERGSVAVGETARLLVYSGLPDQTLWVDVQRGGRLITRRLVIAGRDGAVIETPITEKDRGGFDVILFTARDHQFMRLSKSVFVPWDNKKLTVAFSTFRDKLRPGAGEKWTVKITGPPGEETTPEAAELLAYMYDRSLDAFTAHHPPSPLSLYPNLAWSTTSRVSLGRARVFLNLARGFNPPPPRPLLRVDRLKAFDGYGIGGPGVRRRSRGAPVMALAASADAGALAESSAETDHVVKKMKRAPARKAAKRADDEETLLVFAGEDDAGGSGGEIGEASVPLRHDFSETAFWKPHLLTGPDNSAAIEFTTPDSVTSWSVWVHAITRDLKSGSVNKEAKSVKDLMVRPYLPRFLREGDRAVLKVVVNNASDREITGEATLDIIDPETGESLLPLFGLAPGEATGRPFTVDARGSANLAFPVVTPSRVGLIAFKVTAVSGDFTDGELRPIPILPGRIHLAQSRFVVLKDKDRREMTFPDLRRDDDPTRIDDRMVVTLDGQLFYGVLNALPYLVNYPYECTEQTLNRFVSTGILSTLYQNYPGVRRMAETLSKRETRLESWDEEDPNRKMALEETPWLQQARGGAKAGKEILNVLDPKIAAAHREASLNKLKKSQTGSGGFPWFPGGPPSPYMTMYILYGFAKGLEFGMEPPAEMVEPAWAYLHRHYLDTLVKEMMDDDRGWEAVTFLNYILTAYPAAAMPKGVFTRKERDAMLRFSFKHWKRHSPCLKAHLALTLMRHDRPKDARLVWESVMDSAKTETDQGTFWAPEDRSWLWYNDTIETHAAALRTHMDLYPEDPRLDGLALWLFLNKKLNHWKSTRATAEVIYSLASWLKRTGRLGVREEALVRVGHQETRFVFEPDEYTGGKNRIVIPGNKIDPETTSTIIVEKETPGYLFASSTWHFSTEKLPGEARGDYLEVRRSFFKRVKTVKEIALLPLAEGASLTPGDEVEVHVSITAKHPMEYVHLRDPRGAGFEPGASTSRHRWDLGIHWYEEVRDSGMNFFFSRLPKGEYTFKHRLRAATAGVFKVAPAILQPMYAPEFTAYSAGAILTVE